MVSSVIRYDARERRNELLLEVKNSLVDKWLSLTGDVQLSKHIACLVVDSKKDESKIKEIFEFVSMLFASKGLGLENAIEYMSNHREVLESSKIKIIAMLSVLSIAHLEDEALLEYPKVFSGNYTVDRMYSSVKRQNDTDVSMDSVLHKYEEERKLPDTDLVALSNIKLKMFMENYLKNQTKNINNSKETRL